MRVLLDITGIDGNRKKIAEKVERAYPYIGYMPIEKGRIVKDDKVYLVLDVLNCD